MSTIELPLPDAWLVPQTVARLHADALVWDMTLPWEESFEASRGDTLERLHASGVDVVSLTVAGDREDLDASVRHIAAERRRIAADARLVFSTTVADIRDAKAAGRLAVAFNMQGTNPLGGNADMVSLYYDLGVRHMLMAYNSRNLVGDGCAERTDAGLSRFGLIVVEEMNRVGMLVDCSHTGYRTSMDVFEASKAPVIFSHADARALKEHDRNITDDQIDACAESGGVIGVNGIGPFLGDNDASTELFVRHMDYIAQRVGARHVGIGLDFVYFEREFYDLVARRGSLYPAGYPPPPWQLVQPEQLPETTERLLGLGYSEDDVRGILGENWARVAEAVWK